MAKFKFILILLLFLIAKGANAMISEEENNKNISQQFIVTVPSSNSPEQRMVKVTHLKEAGGSGNNGIYEITENERHFIGKALRDIPDEGKKEQQIQTYEKLNTTVEHLNTQENLPKFVRYVGSFRVYINQKEEHILLLERAKGFSLQEFGKLCAQEKNREKVKPHLARIGMMLGNFHAYEEGSWSHGDFQPGSNNIFYDPITYALTLIDYSRLRKVHVKAELEKLCKLVFRCFEGKEYKQLFFHNYLESLKNESTKEYLLKKLGSELS